MLFRAKPDSPEGGLRPPAGDAPPPLFFYFFRKNSRDDLLPGATYFCIFGRRSYAVGNPCVLYQM